jgi:23S rRNA pseudouridine2605 synthase
MILTNDGELTQKLTHPSHMKEKEYELSVDRQLSAAELSELRSGIPLEDGFFMPDRLKEISPTRYQIIIHEGRNRLIRRAISYFGSEIITLKRTRMAQVSLSNLKPGEYRPLSSAEVEGLYNA